MVNKAQNVTLQLKLFEASGNIEVHYLDPQTDGFDYTAGIENQDGTEGLQYYYGTDALPEETAVQYSLWQYLAPDVTVIDSSFDFTIFDTREFCMQTGPSRACPAPRQFNPQAFCANPRADQYCDPVSGAIDEVSMCTENPHMPGCNQSWGTGLNIQTEGNVLIENVGASGHGRQGLKIGDWERDVRANDVSIDPSTFNNNGYNGHWGGGMDVNARGDITLLDVSASGNTYYGAYLDNAWLPMTIDEASFCNNGGGQFCEQGQLNDGWFCAQNPPYLCTGNSINVDQFCNNSHFGGYCIPDLSDGFVPGMVSVTDSTFNNNGQPQEWHLQQRPSDPGLSIWSYGHVTLDNVDALDNPGGGAYIENDQGCYGAFCEGVAVAGQAGEFNLDGGVVAAVNGVGPGAWLPLAEVTITDSNFDFTVPVTFDGQVYCEITRDPETCNGGEEFFAPAFCQRYFPYCNPITFEIDVDALCGDNPGIPGCTGQSYGTGLEIYTHGDATLTNVGASGNGLNGLIIGDPSVRANNVFIDPSTFNNNGFGGFWGGQLFDCPSHDPQCNINQNGGLEVFASGNVVLDQVTASGNAGFGAYVDNAFGQTAIHPCPGGQCETVAQVATLVNGHEAGNVSIFDSVFLGNGSFEKRPIFDPTGQPGNNHFWNGNDGLRVSSDGDVNLLGVNASENFGNGASLGCVFGIGGCPSSVQVAQSIFNNNGRFAVQLDPNDPLFHQTLVDLSGQQDGLVIAANGNVLVTEVSASGNAGNGLAVAVWDDLIFGAPTSSGGPPTIFINNSNASFNDNGLNGIMLLTPYEAYLAYVNALRNTYYGIFAPAVPDLLAPGVGMPGPALVDLLCVNRSGNVADLFVDGPVIDHGCGDVGDGGGGGGGGGVFEGDDFIIVETPTGPLLIPVTGVGGSLLDQLGTYKGFGTIDDGEELDNLMSMLKDEASLSGSEIGAGWTVVASEKGAIVALPEGSGDSIDVSDLDINDLTQDQYLGLPGGEVVLGGLQVDVTVDGTSVVELPSEGMIVSFPVPEGTPPGLTFTIKVWDPLLGWLSLETIVSPDGYAVAATPFAGTFILTATSTVE